ncbi:hypothetical protein [Faecalibacter bovis]|uniref:Chromosome segregation protein SMC n=1 Tax=Faecalibacter bovis TaxID=2898187 RepID=A0ABX7XGM6_9FLAO|nr:hypothetical protein [Faecalibacter bovis]QTV06986.1 hypothetical protein J9309_06700 [Faecalibacter bovis]
MEQDQKKSNNSTLPIALGVGLLLSLGFNAYQFIDNKNDQETLNKSVKELSAISSEKSQLEFDYKNLQDEFETLKSSIVDNDGLLANKEHDIKIQQEEINKILNDANASKQDLAKAESMIKNLKAEISTYKSEIIRLEKENAILVKNNALLTTERDSITTTLANERTERIVEKQVAQQKEEELSTTLSVSNHKIAPLKVRNNGKEVTKNKANKVDKIRVSFDIDRNSRAVSGNKEIYVAIRKPNGQIGKFGGAESGTLKLHSGDEVTYSDKVNINYQNGAGQTVTFDWEDASFEPGTYKIDIYQNGFKISQADVVLR